MPIYTLRRSQILAMSLERCWNFFSDPRNLEKITPPSLEFRIVSELPNEIHPGLMIRYTVTPLFRVRMTWLTEITQAQSPHFFVDEQRLGPYRLWHHEHFFRAVDSQQTEVRDHVHYVPPFGPFGAILNRFLIRPQLERIFDFREEKMRELAREKSADSFA